jgi:ABC-type branched-subunit amino acid transport system substrate-binding protein
MRDKDNKMITASHIFVRMRYWIPALLVLFAFTPIQAFSEPVDKTIPIGVSLVLSGPWESWGMPIRNGLALGAEQTENPIRLQFQDDRCEAKNSLTNFQKFISIDKISLIILGCMESIEATLPLAEAKGATVLTMGGMSKDFLQKFPNLVSLYTLVDAEAYYLVPYIKDRAKIKRLAIINHSATY